MNKNSPTIFTECCYFTLKSIHLKLILLDIIYWQTTPNQNSLRKTVNVHQS